jgi:hypothetical protein
MRLWALLLGVVGWLGVMSNSAAPSNRTKRQFEASHCDPTRCQIPVSTSSDIKTVKEQTFQTFRYVIGKKQKTIILSRICLIEGDHFYLGQESRFWTKSKLSVFKKRNLGTIPKRFGFVSKTILLSTSFFKSFLSDF